MSKPFDMELFLSGVVKGSQCTRNRHLRQARIIQARIDERWKRSSPWNWKSKDLHWFLNCYLAECAPVTRYRYLLTARLICRRLGHAWVAAPLKRAAKK